MSIAADLAKLQELHDNNAHSAMRSWPRPRTPSWVARPARPPASRSPRWRSLYGAVLSGPVGPSPGSCWASSPYREVKRSGNVFGERAGHGGRDMGAVILVANAIMAVVFLYAMTHWQD